MPAATAAGDRRRAARGPRPRQVAVASPCVTTSRFSAASLLFLQETAVRKRRVLEQTQGRGPEGAPRPGASAGGRPSEGGKGGRTGRSWRSVPVTDSRADVTVLVRLLRVAPCSPPGNETAAGICACVIVLRVLVSRVLEQRGWGPERAGAGGGNTDLSHLLTEVLPAPGSLAQPPRTPPRPGGSPPPPQGALFCSFSAVVLTLRPTHPLFIVE